MLPVCVLVVFLAATTSALPTQPQLPDDPQTSLFWDKVKVRVTRDAGVPSVGIYYEDSPETLARDIAEMESSGALEPNDRSKRGGLFIVLLLKAFLALILAEEVF